MDNAAIAVSANGGKITLRGIVGACARRFLLGLWFLFQLIEANFGLFSAGANGGGVAFFGHVGGFIFGVITARVLMSVGRALPQDYDSVVGAPA